MHDIQLSCGWWTNASCPWSAKAPDSWWTGHSLFTPSVIHFSPGLLFFFPNSLLNVCLLCAMWPLLYSWPVNVNRQREETLKWMKRQYMYISPEVIRQRIGLIYWLIDFIWYDLLNMATVQCNVINGSMGSAVQSLALLSISAMRLWASSDKGPRVSTATGKKTVGCLFYFKFSYISTASGVMLEWL